MRHPSRSTSAVYLCLLAIVGCGDEDVKGTADVADSSVAATDTGTVSDTFVPFETTVAPTDAGGDSVQVEDSSTPTDTSTPDVQTGCNTFGCECQGNGDCLDNYCIEGVDGQICTRTCIESCPDGFECIQTITVGDPVSLCVPQFTRICRPCEDDGDCQAQSDPYPAYCITDDDPRNGSFCASSCASRDCPEGYTCSDVTTQSGGPARQCMPTSGECSCRPGWNGLGFTTECKVVNAFGACDGTRTCGPNGLTACTGPQATPELCDGDDNDCNGTPDDIPAVACLVTNQYGSCNGTTACGIGATACVGPEAGPETCDGEDDNCNSQTDEGSCEDGLTCTTDSCKNGSDCEHALNQGQCLINGSCWSSNAFNPLSSCEICDPARSTVTWSQTGNTCVIGGSCYPAGAVNPQNACQICNPNQTNSAWTNAANSCQIGGQCYLQNDPNPANACEICVPSTSTTTWTQASNTCNIQGQCYAAGVKKSGEPCYVCDPSRSSSGWSPSAPNSACNDSSACSNDDHCDGAGTCVGNKSCNDGIACTQDICGAGGCDNTQVTAGQCRINGVCWNEQNQNPNNQCQWCNTATTQTTWSNKPSDEGCSDGNACTLNDHCSGGGSCTAGAPKVCNDFNQCTSDSCNTATGACTTSNTSGGCDDGNACTAVDTCGGGSCNSSPVQDGSEPNNGITAARSLSASDICDNQSINSPPASQSLSGTLYGVGDEDWYKFRIDDDCSNSYQPDAWAQLQNLPANMDYNLCIYYACDDWGDGDEGTVKFGGASTVSLNGQTLKGACSTNGGTANEQAGWYPSCDNSNIADDDTGTAYIRVYRVSGDWTCSAYTLRFGDN